MGTITNKAYLSYNGTNIASNIAIGESPEIIKLTKTALSGAYKLGDEIVYVVSIVNSGSTSLSSLILEDNLGKYEYTAQQDLIPLNYVSGSVQYYINGVIQNTSSLEIVGIPTLKISNISIPKNGNAMLIYRTTVNNYAPLEKEKSIINKITLSDGVTSNALISEAEEEINVIEAPMLSISKLISTAIVDEKREVTYTFVMQNTGNTATLPGSGFYINDDFNPKLDITSVTLDGEIFENYYYDSSGRFSTENDSFIIPAAQYERDTIADIGAQIVHPGVTVLKVVGYIS